MTRPARETAADKKARVLHALKGEAKRTAQFYMLPVYLVGSALIDANEKPRDYDVRVQMPDEQFTRLFGDPLKWTIEGQTGRWTEIRYRWSDECVKRSREASRACSALVDVQIYPPSYWKNFGHLPRLLLARPSRRLSRRAKGTR